MTRDFINAYLVLSCDRVLVVVESCQVLKIHALNFGGSNINLTEHWQRLPEIKLVDPVKPYWLSTDKFLSFLCTCLQSEII